MLFNFLFFLINNHGNRRIGRVSCFLSAWFWTFFRRAPTRALSRRKVDATLFSLNICFSSVLLKISWALLFTWLKSKVTCCRPLWVTRSITQTSWSLYCSLEVRCYPTQKKLLLSVDTDLPIVPILLNAFSIVAERGNIQCKNKYTLWLIVKKRTCSDA